MISTISADFQTPPHRRAQRILQLDILRGVAILLVMGFHPAVYPAAGGRLSWLAWGWNLYGWTGVELFFVLSGFLVGGLLLEEWKLHQQLDVRRFLIRRGLKIWPAYFIYVSFILFWFLWQSPPEYKRPILIAMAPNFLHLQNYVPTLAVHTWTLAVEEHFYLLLPFVLLFAVRAWLGKRTLLIAAVTSAALLALFFAGLSRLAHYLFAAEVIPKELAQYYQPYTHASFLLFFGGQLFVFALVFLLVRHFCPGIHALPWLAGSMLVLCLVFRVLTHWLSPQLQLDPSFTVYATHLRMDALFFGVLLAYFWHFKPEKLRALKNYRGVLLLAGIAALTLVVFWPTARFDTHLADRSLLYLACGALLLAAIYTQPGVGWAGILLVSRPAKLIAAIGYHSYSIYLWHINPLRYTLISALTERLKPFLGLTGQWVVLTLIYLIISLLTGIVLGKLIEKPALLLRDRLFPARAIAIDTDQRLQPFQVNHSS